MAVTDFRPVRPYDRTGHFILQAPFAPAGDQPQAINELSSGLASGLAHQVLLGVTGSGKTLTMAGVIAAAQRSALILAPNKTLASQLYAELRSFFPTNAVEFFVSYYDYYQPEAYVPSTDTYISKDASINEHIEQMRLSATKALLERKDTIIVASVSAIYGLGDPVSYLSMVLHLDRGDRMEQRKVLRRLADLQYIRNNASFTRGTFRVVGDTVDVFPAESEKEALRIVWFDDEIEGLWLIDPLTGRNIRALARYTIFPKTHYVTPKERLIQALDKIREELRARLEELYAQNRLVEAQRLEQRTLFDMEMMQELGYCNGIENYARYLSRREPGEPPPTLFDYLPSDALLFVDESHVAMPQLRAMYLGDRSRKETLVNYGFRLPSALDNRPLRFDEFLQLSPQTIYVSATPGNYELETAEGAIIEQVIRPTGLVDPEVEVRPAKYQVEDVLAETHLKAARNERMLITTLTKRMSEDLTEYLLEHGAKVRYMHSDIDTIERAELVKGLRKGDFDVLVGINLLREGLDLPEVSLVAILDADKEGFLRSERSLIQTIGRAARHLHGKAILYADRVTDSMAKAMQETARRRTMQNEYNLAHGITPTGISKAVIELIDGLPPVPDALPMVAESPAVYEPGTAIILEEDAQQRIAELQARMHQHAEKLEFELAARIRDEITQIQAALPDTKLP